MSARIYTASEAAALLAAAEAGPYAAPGEDGVIWPARETAFDPIGAASLRLDEARGAANGALLAASWDLATSVVHHAERADRAEAEIERLRADLDLALIHAGNAQRWATGRVLRVTAQASAERERHARELEELRFQLDEMAAVLLAARAGDALSDDLRERARSRSASLTEARAAMERDADLARDVLAGLGAPSGTMKEIAAWCREHLVRVDAVGVMAAGLAAAESASDAAHAILLDAIGGLVADSARGGDVVGLARIAAHEIAAAWEAIGTPPAGTLAGAIRRIREGDYSRGQLSAILGRREGELTREAAARVVAERDAARAEVASMNEWLDHQGAPQAQPDSWLFGRFAALLHQHEEESRLLQERATEQLRADLAIALGGCCTDCGGSGIGADACDGPDHYTPPCPSCEGSGLTPGGRRLVARHARVDAERDKACLRALDLQRRLDLRESALTTSAADLHEITEEARSLAGAPEAALREFVEWLADTYASQPAREAAEARDSARVRVARLERVLAVERGDASRAPDGWHFDGMEWWRNDDPRRPIVLVRRRAGERLLASVWYRPGIDGDTDGPEHSTALEAMEAADAAQGDP